MQSTQVMPLDCLALEVRGVCILGPTQLLQSESQFRTGYHTQCTAQRLMEMHPFVCLFKKILLVKLQSEDINFRYATHLEATGVLLGNVDILVSSLGLTKANMYLA